MEFVIKKSDLVRELQTVTGVVEKRTTLPILANLLLEAKDSTLQVGASDLEVTIRGEAEAQISKPGSITLPAAKLHEIARSLPESDVTFQVGDRNQVAIKCDRTRYRISGQPRDEFPNFPESDPKKGIELPGKVLHRMIERVAFAITTEDPRYSLNGALFMLEGSKLTLVATDGHRLAFISKSLELGDSRKDVNVIVPRKALGEVAKLTGELGEDDKVIFGRAENHVYFIVGRHKLTSNVLEGKFPNYQNVMPKDSSIGLTISSEEFLQAVRRVSLLSSDRFGRAVRLSLAANRLELFSKTEVGEAHETINLDYDGEEMSIGFNARYLIEFLNVVGTPSVRLELNPAGKNGDGDKVEPGDKPGQLRPDTDDGFDYRYVVMPMHL